MYCKFKIPRLLVKHLTSYNITRVLIIILAKRVLKEIGQQKLLADVL